MMLQYAAITLDLFLILSTVFYLRALPNEARNYSIFLGFASLVTMVVLTSIAFMVSNASILVAFGYTAYFAFVGMIGAHLRASGLGPSIILPQSLTLPLTIVAITILLFGILAFIIVIRATS